MRGTTSPITVPVPLPLQQQGCEHGQKPAGMAPLDVGHGGELFSPSLKHLVKGTGKELILLLIPHREQLMVAEVVRAGSPRLWS